MFDNQESKSNVSTDIETRVSNILYFEYYMKFAKSILRTLNFSRIHELKKDPDHLLALQKAMAHQLANFQGIVREGRNLLANETDQLKVKSINRRIDTHKHLAIALQIIADGIAWRNMGFQRPIMRLLSENASPGFIDKELEMIDGLDSKDVIIINDLTRFCRIGDFTRITSDGKIVIYEAKTSKLETKLSDTGDILSKATGPGKPKITTQERRQVLVQSAIINRKIDIPIFKDDVIEKILEVEIIDIDTDIKTHFKRMKSAIKKSGNEFISTVLVEDGYLLKVTNYDALKRDAHNTPDKIVKRHEMVRSSIPKWVIDSPKDVIQFDTYHAFFDERKQFPRNILPYSVFPISNKHCTKMILGYLRIKTYFDLSYFEGLLKNRGWEVERFNIDQFTTNETGRDLFPKDHLDTLFKVKKNIANGIYSTSISLTEILQMISSYYTTSFLLDSLENRSVAAMTRRRGKLKIAPNYINEKSVLI